MNILTNKYYTIIISTILILIVLITISCTENTVQQNNLSNNTNLIYLQNLNYSNVNNPLDSCGYFHNYFLDYFIQNTELHLTNEEEFKSELYRIINEIGDLHIFNTTSQLGKKVLDLYYDSTRTLSILQTIEQFSYNNYIKIKLINLFSLISLDDKDTINFTVDSLNALFQEIKDWENEIITNLNYTIYDSSNKVANQLLGTASIMRYSLAYWVTVFQDTNSKWRQLISIPPTTKKHFYTKNKIQLTGWELAGIALALTTAGYDAKGYVWGFERPALDENNRPILDPNGNPVMEYVRGTEGAFGESGSFLTSVWEWFKGIF